MTPYRMELIHQENNIYLFTVYTKNNEIMLQSTISKEQIPDVMAKYLCVGKYTV